MDTFAPFLDAGIDATGEVRTGTTSPEKPSAVEPGMWSDVFNQPVYQGPGGANTQDTTDSGYFGDVKGVINDSIADILSGAANPAPVAIGGTQLSGAFPEGFGNPYGTMATEESDYGSFATPNFAGQQAPYGGTQ